MRRAGFSHKKTPGRQHERKEKKPLTQLSFLNFYTISASVKQQDYQFDPLSESHCHEFDPRWTTIRQRRRFDPGTVQFASVRLSGFRAFAAVVNRLGYAVGLMRMARTRVGAGRRLSNAGKEIEENAQCLEMPWVGVASSPSWRRPPIPLSNRIWRLSGRLA